MRLKVSFELASSRSRSKRDNDTCAAVVASHWLDWKGEDNGRG